MAQLNPVTPLYSPSVTATNGSDTITVTGSVDCSFVRSGTTVFITGRQPVRAISGTVPNGSGVSTIKLKVAWSYPTTTGELLAINTYEGLADAIYQLGALVDAAEANQNKVFEYKGSYDLAAAGALPPAPASGSALYRISTQATVSSRLYRVGEPIYYDNLTSQWRSMWDGLGTAAYSNTMTSTTDTSTAGALLRRGDFGFGGFTVAPPSNDFNLASQTAAYRVDSGALNVDPLLVVGSNVFNMQYDANDRQQFGIARNTDNFLFRKEFNGTFGPWRKVWHDGNLPVQANTADVTTGAALIMGAFGIGSGGFGIPSADCNLALLNATYNVGGTATNAWPNRQSGDMMQVLRFSSTLSHQIGYTRNRTIYHRTINNGVADEWTFNYNQRNILGTVSQSAGVPTGAIIESGSNANGDFIRYANGTQICRFKSSTTSTASTVSGSVVISPSLTATYPAAFSAVPQVSPAQESSGGITFLNIYAITATQCTFELAGTANSGTTVSGKIGYIAIGRWF